MFSEQALAAVQRRRFSPWREVFLIALLGSIGCLSACSDQYSAAAITARVVDLETGKPLFGVHVVADWQLQGGLEGGSYLGSVKTMERTTDESGQFQFPAWGPIEVARPSGVYSNARVRWMAPELILFKPGFGHEELSNQPGKDPDPRGMRSIWDGQTIKLKPFHGTAAQYLRDLTLLSEKLQSATAERSFACSKGQPCLGICQWQNIPDTIRAVGQELGPLHKAVEGATNSGLLGHLIGNDAYYLSYGCSSPIAVFGQEKK